jgi:hypothetical protein
MTIPFKISELLGSVFEKTHEDDADMLSLSDIMLLLHDRGFGILIVLFSMPNFVPAFIPLIATVFALPQMIFCVQMMLKYDAPKLPDFIARKQIKRTSLQAGILKSLPMIKKMEKIVRPRLEFMLTPSSERIVAGFMLLFAFVIAIPAPLTNFVPSVALFIMGIGILARDGLAIIVGIIIGLGWTYALIFFSAKIIAWLAGL